MISHLTVGVADLDRAAAFYGPLLGRMGWQEVHNDEKFRGYALGFLPSGRPIKPMFWACLPHDGLPASVGNGVHVAFMTGEPGAVDDVHRMALGMGARDEGAPGYHPEYHEFYYAAFFRDPDGNKVQVCCHEADPARHPGPTGAGGCG